MVKYFLLIISILIVGLSNSHAQSSSALDKMQSNSGLMLGTGVVLTVPSAVLIGFGANYLKRGIYTESMTSGTAVRTINGTRKGAILLSTGGVILAGAVTLLALGGKMRHEYKLQKKSLTVGCLESGGAGLNLSF